MKSSIKPILTVDLRFMNRGCTASQNSSEPSGQGEGRKGDGNEGEGKETESKRRRWKEMGSKGRGGKEILEIGGKGRQEGKKME